MPDIQLAEVSAFNLFDCTAFIIRQVKTFSYHLYYHLYKQIIALP